MSIPQQLARQAQRRRAFALPQLYTFADPSLKGPCAAPGGIVQLSMHASGRLAQRDLTLFDIIATLRWGSWKSQEDGSFMVLFQAYRVAVAPGDLVNDWQGFTAEQIRSGDFDKPETRRGVYRTLKIITVFNADTDDRSNT